MASSGTKVTRAMVSRLEAGVSLATWAGAGSRLSNGTLARVKVCAGLWGRFQSPVRANLSEACEGIFAMIRG